MNENIKKYLYLTIFLTGGIILALEVLSSKIMSPYFGVSLYIWTSILSITLIGLAIGYWLGGILTKIFPKDEKQIFIFLLICSVVPIFIFISRVFYPHLFPLLAKWNLILGSFVACIALLFGPLIFLSALNPILISLQNYKSHTDADSGKVFAISTMGSVLGVILTSFFLIPHEPNSRGILFLGMLLSLVVLIVTPLCTKMLNKKYIIYLALTSLSLCLIGYLLPIGWTVPSLFSQNKKNWTTVDEIPSFFGLIKIIDKHILGKKTRLYFQGGSIQSSMFLETNESAAPYNYYLVEGALSQNPEAKNALVLGLAGGLIPTMLKDKGIETTVVEIDSNVLEATKKYFYFDSKKIAVHITDARRFVKKCNKKYDIIIMDLFHFASIPDYLMTTNFFADIKKCMNTNGIFGMNVLLGRGNDQAANLIFGTLLSVFPHVYSSKISPIIIHNVPIFTSEKELDGPFITSKQFPNIFAFNIRKILTNIEEVNPENITTKPATDDYNPFAYIFSKLQLQVNRKMLRNTKEEWLLN